MYYSSYTPVPVLAANLLGNFSVAVTYDLFITLGLITAVPVSAGKEYLQLYKVLGIGCIKCRRFLRNEFYLLLHYITDKIPNALQYTCGSQLEMIELQYSAFWYTAIFSVGLFST